MKRALAQLSRDLRERRLSSVELTREGRMVGDIHAPRVIIVDGASFRGRVDMGEVAPGVSPNEYAARATTGPRLVVTFTVLSSR